MPIILLREIARQLLLGVHALHSQCLAHFDIKLENVGWRMEPDGSIKVGMHCMQVHACACTPYA